MSQSFHQLAVKQKKTETSDTVSIEFDVPASLHEAFTFKPGQYINIDHTIAGESLRRSYSLCTAPHEGRWAIGVKKVQGGRMSTFLVDELESASELTISVPEGTFIGEFDASKRRHHYFVAAGSGITPIMSLLKAGLEEEPMSTFHLLYGSKTDNQIIFNDELMSLQDKYGDQLQIRHALSQKPASGSKLFGLFGKKTEDGPNWSGRIDEKKLSRFAKEFPFHKMENQVYLCGPGALIQLAEKWFSNQSAEGLSVHREYFTNPDQPAQVSGTPVASVMTFKSLHGKDGSIPLPANKTILDGLMDQGEDPPYSCMNGVCSSCVAKLTKGKVAMDTCLALEDDEINAGYILTCQAKALTPEIEVEFEG